MTTAAPAPVPTDAVIRKLPFYSNIGSITDYPELQDKSYDLIDVEGDGHCAIYAIMLYLIAQAVSYTHLTLPTICSV